MLTTNEADWDDLNRYLKIWLDRDLQARQSSALESASAGESASTASHVGKSWQRRAPSVYCSVGGRDAQARAARAAYRAAGRRCCCR